MLIYDHFSIIQSLQRSPIPQTSNWSGTFFGHTVQESGSNCQSAVVVDVKGEHKRACIVKKKSFTTLHIFETVPICDNFQ